MVEAVLFSSVVMVVTVEVLVVIGEVVVMLILVTTVTLNLVYNRTSKKMLYSLEQIEQKH